MPPMIPIVFIYPRSCAFSLDHLPSRSRGAEHACRIPFGEETREESLALADALDLDGGRLRCLLESPESLANLPGKRCHDLRAALPDATCKGDGERKEEHEHENGTYDVRFFRRSGALDSRWLDHRA